MHHDRTCSVRRWVQAGRSPSSSSASLYPSSGLSVTRQHSITTFPQYTPNKHYANWLFCDNRQNHSKVLLTMLLTLKSREMIFKKNWDLSKKCLCREMTQSMEVLGDGCRGYLLLAITTFPIHVLLAKPLVVRVQGVVILRRRVMEPCTDKTIMQIFARVFFIVQIWGVSICLLNSSCRPWFSLVCKALDSESESQKFKSLSWMIDTTYRK